MSSLPEVNCWVIDFRTARAIFQSGSNFQRNHLIDLCQEESIWFSYTELSLFKSHPDLKEHFMDSQDRTADLDEDAVKRCVSLKDSPAGLRLLTTDETSVVMAGFAAANNCGVISDRTSTVFTTVHQLCGAAGVPCFTSSDYFNLMAA